MSHFIERSKVDGPDIRTVVGVQGCPILCKGCGAPETLAFIPKTIVATEMLLKRILNVRGISGLTLTGGEPFCQAAALAEVARGVRQAGLNVLTFSGYTLDKLERDIKNADLATLSQILGKNVALGIKDQVGEKVEIVKENKRKGQINLKDF